MSLPHEAEVIADIAAKYRTELDAMTGLHEAVIGMMSAGSWRVGKLGLDNHVFETMAALLTKACKTFRSIQILCERGLIDDANVLTRVLMENTVAILFILQKRPRERVRIYHAHAMSQNIKMLNEWKNTSGLKRKAPKEVMSRLTEQLGALTKGLPAGTDFKHHWSGKRSLQEAVKALRHDAIYATLYRLASSTAHASDAGAHVEIEQSSDGPIYQIEPRAQGFEVPSHAARELLWNAANRIDQRLGLGFSAKLAPHKPQKQTQLA